jgi:hypothetical protein
MAAIVGILIGFPVVYILIDVGLALNKRQGDTYSEIIREASKKFMPLIIFICFGMGLLAGHWWW